ncbi:MAG: hypothetical protein RBR22_00575 [Desulfuromonas sp.]|nr:hypothetical protein [Desulfuromonas sp.]
MAHNRWIEIISVRLCDPANGAAVRNILQQIHASSDENSEQEQVAELFLNTKNHTDWSLYLYWRTQVQEPAKTMLGLSVAEAFNALGLVNHSVWTKSG